MPSVPSSVLEAVREMGTLRPLSFFLQGGGGGIQTQAFGNSATWPAGEGEQEEFRLGSDMEETNLPG